MIDRPWLHIVRVDVDPEVEEEFNRWYVEKHIPDLLGCPGWLSARRYTVDDGGPRYAAVYEIAGPWVYGTPDFCAVKGFMHLTPHIRNFQRQVLSPLGA